jgi:hypothetical protein
MRPGPLGGSLADNPLGVRGFSGSEAFWALGEILAAAALPFALVLALAAVIVRVRRSGEVERAQLKWFVAAYLATGAVLTISFADGTTQTIVDLLAPWSLSLPPIAVGIAILRYRLFEIDRIISRTIGWAVVTGTLLAVFGGAVLGLQALLSDVTHGQTLAVAASTLVAFAIFQPVRHRVQSAVDRRFDRARYDGQRTVDAFAEHLRNEVDLARLSGAVLVTADEAVRPVAAGLWLRGTVR